MDVPVWIENPSIDFKICMFDRLYQDALILRNRSSAALRVSVDIQPRSLQNHIEIVHVQLIFKLNQVLIYKLN